MGIKNNFKILLEEEERRFETSGLRDEIDRKLGQRFAFLRLLGDITELFTVRIIDIMIMMSDEEIEPGLYFTPALISDLQTALDRLIERDVDEAIARLKELIDENSEKYRQLLALEATADPNEDYSGKEENLSAQLKAFMANLRRSDLR